MKSLFEICVPRDDIRSGTARDSDFAADLAQVLTGTAPAEYMHPDLFFANTYPTQGLKRLLENIGLRLRKYLKQVKPDSLPKNRRKSTSGLRKARSDSLITY